MKFSLLTLKTFLTGKKTYLVGIAGLIAVALGWSDDQISNEKAIEQIVTLILVMTVRHGVDTSVNKAVSNVISPPVTKPDDGVNVTLK